jgi:type IV secretory pathway component VirB8
MESSLFGSWDHITSCQFFFSWVPALLLRYRGRFLSFIVIYFFCILCVVSFLLFCSSVPSRVVVPFVFGIFTPTFRRVCIERKEEEEESVGEIWALGVRVCAS